MSNEQDQQQQERKPSPEAEKIRSDALSLKAILLADLKAASKPMDIAKILGAALIHCFGWIPEIAAQLAEMNSRDREAEIRAKQAEEFLLGMQQEFQRLQGSGLVVPQMTFKPGDKR